MELRQKIILCIQRAGISSHLINDDKIELSLFGLDSLSTTILIIELEKEFKIDLFEESLKKENFHSIGSILMLMKGKNIE